METVGYKVKLEAFEGPLDLLLHLIKKDELDIYDISIERLTLQYMDYLNTFKRLNIPLASEFIVMASNLMYIKSRALLPKKVQPPEEDVDEDDPRWDLIRQLLEYKKFKEAAQFLEHKQAEQTSIFAKQISLDAPEDAPTGLSETSVFELVKAFQTVLKRFEEENELGEIQNDHFSVAEKIDYLMELFSAGGERGFLDLFAESSSRQEVIVTFLAMLELVKLRELGIKQEGLLGEIIIVRQKG